MALGSSGLYVPTFINALTGVFTLNLGSETTIKLDLLDNDSTPNFDTHDYLADISAGDIVTGTGWAGGYVLTSTTVTGSSGTLLFNAADVSQNNTTLSNIYGCVIYDSGVSSPTANPLLCLVSFSGAPYSTSNGTFQITWANTPDRIFQIDLTP